MSPSARKIAPLLFGSGFCALVYQIAWTREFRMIFGASTAASAAVLAIFIGGLGFGGIWLGKRADRARSPLVLYARLEALVALSAAATPAFFWLIRQAYAALGGTITLGMGGGTVLRLLLSALVLAAPTIAMGGTLPAAARAAESDHEEGRKGVALLYGVNTLGAVTGCFLANFTLLEVFGARLTLWMACLVNLLVAMMALRVERELPDEADQPDEPGGEAGAEGPGAAPASFVLASAAVVGFAFFLMELIWYRMLGPILGGTIFTFGLILAVALLGIGAGGACYAVFGQRRPPTLLGFAYTCLLEAALLILPFALGDRVALFALSLQAVGKLGFWGYVFGWFTVASVVVVPAAFVSGVQFPMLIGLLGRGKKGVGRQIGLTYGWNTVGAAVGSLAGGFGLIPLLGAPGCWRLVAVVLAALGAAAIGLLVVRERRWAAALGPTALLAATLAMQASAGPSAFWRHGSVGAGRFPFQSLSGPNQMEQRLRDVRREITWETDGVESSVALRTSNSHSFIVNGKSDGNALLDAGTQVMSGLLGSLLRPDASTAAVIGLGTGSTAGWLAAVPTIKQVDVFEIEPAIRHVAEVCAPINQGAMNNPKIKLHIADAREALQVTPSRYDIIFSEPSNPYRAGIASLFTRDFYLSASRRLNDQGVFMQWVQGYEIDAQTIRTIYATLSSVFPHVETWVLDGSDLLLVASPRSGPIDAARTRARLETEPYRTAMAVTWGTAGLEGLLSHFVAGPSLAQAIAASETGALNTDDQSPVEFGFARTLGKLQSPQIPALIALARRRGEDRPAVQGEVDWERVQGERAGRAFFSDGTVPSPASAPEGPLRQRLQALKLLAQGDYRGVLEAWRALPQPLPSPTLVEMLMLAEAQAATADGEAPASADALGAYLPNEAQFFRVVQAYTRGDLPGAAARLKVLFEGLRSNPWMAGRYSLRATMLAVDVNQRDKTQGGLLLEALSQPFSAATQEAGRRTAMFELAYTQPDPRVCVEALKNLEPHPPWDESTLRRRLACYNEAHHPMAAQAGDDYRRYLDARGVRLGDGLKKP